MKLILTLVTAFLCGLALANPPALAPLSGPFPNDVLRDYRRVEPARYLVTEPVVIDMGVATIGGQPYHTRGWGPHLDLRGVVFVVSPDFKGDRVLDIVGTHPIIEGLTIDSRWKAVDYGVVWRAKVVNGVSQASGGRGAWLSGGILGKFTKSALYLDCAEEVSFRDLNLVNQGYGVGVTVANGGAFVPGWSQTLALFDGCSFQVYGADAVKMVGHVNDTAFTDCFFATRHNAVDGALCTGRRNYMVRSRVECSSTSTIVSGATSLVFSRGNAIKNVSPLVSGFKAMEPQEANTLPSGLIAD